MFRSPNGKIKHNYRIPLNIKDNYLTDDNLWETPRPEFSSLNVTDIVLSIIEIHKEISFDEIKAILKEHNIPNDLGFIHHATKILLGENKIFISGKYRYGIAKSL